MRYGLLNDLRRLDERELPLIVERYAALAQPAARAVRAAAARAEAASGRRIAPRHARELRAEPRTARGGLCTRRGIRAGEALARAPFRGARRDARRARLPGVAPRLEEGRIDHRRDPAPRRRRGHRPRGPHLARRGDRPHVGRLARGHQRLRPHARGRRPRSSDGRALRLVEPRVHSAALGQARASSRSSYRAARASSASARSAIPIAS